jgi:hypothetical protein
MQPIPDACSNRQKINCTEIGMGDTTTTIIIITIIITIIII